MTPPVVNEIAAKAIELKAKRYEQGLDIWTGKPLLNDTGVDYQFQPHLKETGGEGFYKSETEKLPPIIKLTPNGLPALEPELEFANI